MGRVSQAQAQENRKRIIDTASRLFREQGTHVSVADVMKAAGLTHGGFYKQFASKEALVDEATAHAFAEVSGRRAAADQGRRELIDAYLAADHRDNAAAGCPVAGLAADIARGAGDAEARRTYAEGVTAFADLLAGADGGEGGGEGDGRADGLAQLSTLVGALVLARATKGSPVSEEILAAANKALTAGS
ncbi:TetR family transcriptional regulator [Streptomyces fractus]|uniref:TetR/AcrR family transcriptional regulator n=1 Tax=Streptomyces fractus TaxID=641806 RepID=UPI003CE718C1